MADDPGATHSPCPVCGEIMYSIRGSFNARCRNCGFKDACCF